MKRSLISALALAFLFLASCEDTEKSRNKSETPAVTPSEEQQDTLRVPEPVDTTKTPEETPLTALNIKDKPLLEQEELIPFLTKYGKENPENRVKIITRFGAIEVLLYDNTPLHRANFILLTKLGYFDDTFFHRVAEGFVVQGGNSDDPETSYKRNNIGSYLVPSEFEAGHKHVRGAFSAAKYSVQNVSKASSPFEFFIVQSERGAHHLDNDHTVFGRVTKGMDVVDTIAKQAVGEGEWPLLNIRMKVEILE